jgi:uncharacterized membrane protein YciS (DUF1049 family)
MTEYSEGTKVLFVIGFVVAFLIGVFIYARAKDRNDG